MKKQPSLAAAQKRAIKKEITTHERGLKKSAASLMQELKKIKRAHKALDRHADRLIKARVREVIAVNRRISILQGRL